MSWRRYVAAKLPSGMTAVSALRGREHLAAERVIQSHYSDRPLSTEKGLTRRDRMDVRRCDLLFVNLLSARSISIGTVVEIAWADAFGKPVVLVMTPGTLHDHGIIRELAAFSVPTLDQGIEVAVDVLKCTVD
jgi:nucleoside 2-deoxyribosyltransferase